MTSEIETLLRGPKGYELARKALEAMEANRVWPTALNFELWINFVSASDTPLARELTEAIQSGQPFTDEVGQQIAAQHLPSAKLSGEILEAGQNLSRGLDSVTRAIEAARETSEAYGQQLANASESLDIDDVGSVKAMVATLTEATNKVQEENHALESQLAETNEELGRLREHLEQVRREAMTDALTGLANRKAFDETLEDACRVADLEGKSVTLAFLDIDHFKTFNDTWGHQTGDQVLRYVAGVIARASPGPRTAARTGGEEFAIIFPGETTVAAAAVLDAIRDEVSSRMLKRRSTNEDLGAVTLSAGFAERMRQEAPANLMERADGALYTSKRNGRNRTSAAPPPQTTLASQAA